MIIQDGNKTIVRSLVDLRDMTIQKSRKGFGNRVLAVEQGRDKMDEQQLELVKRWFDRFDSLENDIDREIRALVKDDRVIESMVSVKGVGLMLAAKVASMIDIDRAPTVSALWRYAGYAVIDGEREKMTKGEPAHYNRRLKTTCYLVGTSFLKSNSPYRKIYDAARDYYASNRPDWTKAHQHNAAMRKMIKVWLAHLWEVWRTLEGKPVRNLYVNEQLGHEHYYSPQEYGWKF